MEKKRYSSHNGLRLPLIMAAFFLAFVLLVNCAWPQGREVLQRVLFPWDASARQAVEVFAQELHHGANFSDAMENLCREVLKEAGLAADR